MNNDIYIGIRTDLVPNDLIICVSDNINVSESLGKCHVEPVFNWMPSYLDYLNVPSYNNDIISEVNANKFNQLGITQHIGLDVSPPDINFNNLINYFPNSIWLTSSCFYHPIYKFQNVNIALIYRHAA